MGSKSPPPIRRKIHLVESPADLFWRTLTSRYWHGWLLIGLFVLRLMECLFDNLRLRLRELYGKDVSRQVPDLNREYPFASAGISPQRGNEQSLSFSNLFVHQLGSVKPLWLLKLLHLGLLLKLHLSPWELRAKNAIKAVLETNWGAAISYLIAKKKKKKNYLFVFAVDGVPVMAGTNRMFTAGSAGDHIRGLYSACTNDSIICVNMVDDAQGMISNQATRNIIIIDSGSPIHCTGDISLFSDYTEAETVGFVYGVGGGITQVLGSGTILDGRFHMKDVHYVPGLNPPNTNKTIFSVGKLSDDGYHIDFDDAGGCTVVDKRSRVWSWTKWTWSHEIVGKGHKVKGVYYMDYLRMRAPVSTSEGAGIVKALWNAASSGWSAIITKRPQCQGGTDQRPEV